MNKKFLLIPIALLALAACNKNGGSNSVSGSTNAPSVDTSASTNTSTGASTGTSVAPQKEYISAAALQSIMSTFSMTGTMSIEDIADTNGKPEISSLLYNYAGDSVEWGYAELGETINAKKYFNIDGYVESYYLDVDNVVKHGQVVSTDETTGEQTPIAWPFVSLSKNSNMTIKAFEKTAEGVYTVTNQATRNAIAEVIAAQNYETSTDCYVESMTVKVEDEKITNIKFETTAYDYSFSFAGLDYSYTFKDSYDLNISNHGTTVVENDVVAYETYPEAAALTAAFNKLTGNLVVKETATLNNADYADIKVYFTDEAYYGESSVTDAEDGTTISKAGYYAMASTGYIYEFAIDADNAITTNGVYQGYTLETAGLTYLGNLVAGEMFEYENGKYVTRSAADAQNVGQYLLVDGNESALTELTVALTDDGSIDEITYQVAASAGTYKFTVKFESNESGVLPIEGFNAYKVELATYASIDEDAMGYWIDMANNVSIDVSYTGVYYGGEKVENVTVSEAGAVISGVVNEKAITITSVPAVDDNSDATLSIAYDGKTAEAVFDYLSLVTNYYGIPSIPFAQNATDYAFEQDEDTGAIYFAFYGENDYTAEDLATYVATIIATKGYTDVSSLSSDWAFTNGTADQTIAEYLGVTTVLLDAEQQYYFLCFTISQGAIVMMLF